MGDNVLRDSIKNIFADIPLHFTNEWVDNLLQASTLRMERIVSRGHCSPEGFWYDQDEHEWVVLLKGQAVLRFEAGDETVKMNPGDYLHIEKHCRHRVEWTDPERETIWLALHYR